MHVQQPCWSHVARRLSKTLYGPTLVLLRITHALLKYRVSLRIIKTAGSHLNTSLGTGGGKGQWLQKI